MGIKLHANEVIKYKARRYWGACIKGFFDEEENDFKNIYITNTRLVIYYGWLGKEPDSIPIDHVFKIEPIQNFWHGIFGVGTIKINSLGQTVFELKRVNLPKELVREFNEVRYGYT